jgi:hypothetical protein
MAISAGKWLDRINQADKAEKQWRIRAGKIITKYRSDDGVDLQGNKQAGDVQHPVVERRDTIASPVQPHAAP